MLSEQLKSAGLRPFPCWLRKDPKTGKWLKGPAVPKGVSWKDAPNLPDLDWAAKVLGLPIPARVLILDRDTYKGATREAFEQWVGAPLDWDLALVQLTVSGGDHYAFRCDWDARQLQNDQNAPVGWDTRAAGKGFICTGEGYTPVGMGVFRLACPDSLPRIPDAARSVLEAPAPPPPKEHTPSDLTDDQLTEALRFIDPGCDRAGWVRVGLALKHHYQEDDDAGRDVFDRWSAGEFWPNADPDNYVAEHIDHQWASFKAEGGVTVATLYYKAIQAGWTPPATFDTALAFGAGAADAGVFEKLVERVQESGGDIRQTGDLLNEIRSSGCNALQVSLLSAELKGALREAGIKDKAVMDHIDGVLKPQSRPRAFVPSSDNQAATTSGSEHTEFGAYPLPQSCDFPGDDINDAIFLLAAVFKNRLRVYAGRFYWWTGRRWEVLSDGSVKKAIGLLIRADRKKATASRVRSVFEGMRDQAVQIPELDPPGPRVFFPNGVLDLLKEQIRSPDPENGNTRTLSVDYEPSSQCPQWQSWLHDIFQSEPERVYLLQELFGWLLLRGNLGIEKAALFVGPTRAGKGVVLRILKALLCDALGAFSFSQLDDPKTLASMRGKNAVADGDATGPEARSARAHNGTFKTITSNDPFSVRLLYTQETWQGQLHCKLLMLCNSVPSMYDDSAATANRFLPLVFDRSYLNAEDPALFSRLVTELPGIAAWAVGGLLRLAKRGRFDLPQSSVDQLSTMISDGGGVWDFINEALQIGEQFRCSDATLWDAYRTWAINNGHEISKRRHALKSLEDALRCSGIRRSKSVRLEDGRDYRGFFGVDVLPEKTALNVFAFQQKDS